MLAALAEIGLRHPRRTAALALAFFAVAAVFGGPAASRLRARNGLQDPSSQAARSQRLIERATGAEAHPGVLALVGAPPGSPAVASAAATLASVPGVAGVRAPSSSGDPALVARDGRSSLVAATLRAAPNPTDVSKRVEAAFRGRRDVRLGGTDVANEQVSVQANSDLRFAELLAFPLLTALALLIFRGVAALLPVAVGATAVLGTYLVLRLVNAALPLSTFALNLVIGLGLGLAIDYSLFLVSRFREELGGGAGTPEALRVTMATAGRTVVFSALTVAAAMATLAIFPQRFLVSMGIGGATVSLVAAAAALLILPALFVLLGARIGRVRPGPPGTGRWYRLAHAVMRRPGLVAAATAVALLVVASPTLRASWTGIDAGVLPASRSARAVSDTLARQFEAHNLDAITIAAPAGAGAATGLAAYAVRLGTVPGVSEVGRPQYLGRGVWKLTLGVRGDPLSPEAQRAVSRVRAVPAPVPVEVGGQAADFRDQRAAIANALPLALVALGGVMLLILWVMTGSVVLPVKSLLMNALTVATATGLLVFVFQDGRLTGPLDYTSQGGIEQTDFLILAAIVFALATDYGIFLLTRIKEAHDAGLPDREAVAVGLERTGRIVTAAAILLAAAIGAFSISEVVFLKEVGLGVAAAVMIDAFVVRALLVPSLMALLGRWNWWQPSPLRRLHARLVADGRRREPAVVGGSG